MVSAYNLSDPANKKALSGYKSTTMVLEAWMSNTVPGGLTYLRHTLDQLYGLLTVL